MFAIVDKVKQQINLNYCYLNVAQSHLRNVHQGGFQEFNCVEAIVE